MNGRVRFFLKFLAYVLALAAAVPAAAEDYGQAKVNPASLAEQDLAAESRGDVAGALTLYSDDAIVQYGGLCWTPCVGKAAIQQELERRGRSVDGGARVATGPIKSDTSG